MTKIPAHLPDRLTITLWDFSWYTRTGPGEPFADLDEAFAQAVHRGYNTVRICAMPFLLFGSGMDTSALTFTGLGGDYGQRTRWYDVRRQATVDGRAQLLALFAAARRHDCYVILSSWEYQQSPSLLDNPQWSDALLAIPPRERAQRLAEALDDLIGFLTEAGLDDRIAFTELHNEAPLGKLAEAVPPGEDPMLGLRPYLESAVAHLKSRHPDRLFTVNYQNIPAGTMRGLPGNLDVGVFHCYVYGVLGELVDAFALRDTERPFPQRPAREQLLAEDAPDLADWTLPESERWRHRATIMSPREVYVHDWCDPVKWDRWLYERYATHRVAMSERLCRDIAVAADWTSQHDVPLVFGEGWVGYTPLYGRFEEGPVGIGLIELAVTEAARAGAWGMVLCSNAAPHHPMWTDVADQRRLNERFVKEAR